MTNFQYNDQQFNHDNIYLPQDIDGVVVFGDINLMSLCEDGHNGIIIQSMNLYDLDNIEVSSYESGVYDWWWVYGVRYATRLLSIRLFIQEMNNENLIKTIDDIKKKTLSENQIIVKWKWYSDTKRKQRAILRWIEFWDIGSDDYISDVKLDIILLDGYWSEVDDIQKLVPSVTGEVTNIITNHWGYESYPKIIINCWMTGNAMNGIEILIRKLGELSWYSVYIDEIISDGDLIVFDYVNKEVLHNNVPVTFYWPMTPLDIGSNEVIITPDGTINASVNISYVKTRL